MYRVAGFISKTAESEQDVKPETLSRKTMRSGDDISRVNLLNNLHFIERICHSWTRIFIQLDMYFFVKVNN